MSADKDNLMDPTNPNSPYNKFNWDSPYSILNPLSPHCIKSEGGSGDPYEFGGGLVFIVVMVVVATFIRFCI